MNYLTEALRIHENSIVINAHYDLPGEVYHRRRNFNERSVLKKVYLSKLKEAGYNIIVAAVFLENQYCEENAYQYAIDQINEFSKDVEETNGHAKIIKRIDDFEDVITNNKIGFILSLEGVEPIGKKLEHLDEFYKLGVRAVGLLWSRKNEVGYPCSSDSEANEKGLLSFGKTFVEECSKKNVLIDLAHISEGGFYEVINHSEKPIIVSHSNSKDVHDHHRNLSIDQIKAIQLNGGVIGVNSLRIFIGNEDEHWVMKICDHIDSIIKHGSIDNVGFGFDYCNDYIRYSPFLDVSIEEMKRKYDVMDSINDSLLITAELLKRGYSENDLKQVIGGNFARVIKEYLKT
ncbi:membrane dipeptidase [Acidaminobacter sp. JC074]|uniref:dipeptidase n=1 Tax=Acidaminobacter sp. JC074 TaxID=2530199 RepID=UPI001F0D43C6